jgi:hypothetical protein
MRYSSSIALNILSSRQSYTQLKLALRSASTIKTFTMSGPTTSNPLEVRGAMVATCIGMALKINTESTPSCCNCVLVEGEKPHPVSNRGCTMRKNSKGEEHNELPKDPLGGCPKSISPEQSPRHSRSATTGTADI